MAIRPGPIPISPHYSHYSHYPKPLLTTENEPPDGQTTEKLVSERLGLGDSAETTVVNLLRVKLDGVFGEVEPLLDDGGELADTATLLTEDVLGTGGPDDDLGTSRGDADFDTRVSLLGQLASQELVELGKEHTYKIDLSILSWLSN